MEPKQSEQVIIATQEWLKLILFPEDSSAPQPPLEDLKDCSVFMEVLSKL